MKYCKVSRKKILVEELAALLLWFVISIFPFIYIDTFSFWWWAVLLPPLVLYLGAALFYIPASYRNTCYLINTSKVIYQRGVIIRRQQIMARKRIVYVTLMRTPLTPLFHTADVIVRATGATIVIKYLDLNRAKEIVRFLAPGNEL
ncbi:MAG: PH domain-containing protein [Massilioclostridium sp.]|nr:PH domain-containing protein [Massilioclostridium sp.]